MSGLIHSVRWLSVAQASKILSQLVSVVVLSRILPPADYGVMALAAVVVTFAGLLRDMGTGAAIIQRKDLTNRLADTVFWMNILLGCALGLILAGSASHLAEYFREPQLQQVLLLLSITFPVSSLTAVHQATMERAARFRELAILDVMTQLTGLVLSVGSALAGLGVLSFVVPTLFSVTVTTGWLWFKSGFRPGRAWDRSEFKSLWSFSANLTAFNFINYFARNADSMIIGRLLGANLLGQYGMAYKLMLFPVQHMSWVIGRALLPRLSSIQDDLTAVRELYLKVLGGIALLSVPIMFGLWSLREPFTDLVLGDKWYVVADLLAWFAPVGLMQSFMSTIGSTLTSLGRTRALFLLGIFNTATTLFGFVIGAQFGVVGVAIGYFIANLLNFGFTVVFMGRWLEARFCSFWNVLKAPVSSALVMVLTIFALDWALRVLQVASIPSFVVLVGGGVVAYLMAMSMIFKMSLRVLLNAVKGKA